jgi:hypothetical protein
MYASVIRFTLAFQAFMCKRYHKFPSGDGKEELSEQQADRLSVEVHIGGSAGRQCERRAPFR